MATKTLPTRSRAGKPHPIDSATLLTIAEQLDELAALARRLRAAAERLTAAKPVGLKAREEA